MALNYDAIRTVTISLGQYKWYMKCLYMYRLLQNEGFFSIPNEMGAYVETIFSVNDEDEIRDTLVQKYYNEHKDSISDGVITMTRDRFRELILTEIKIDYLMTCTMPSGSVCKEIYKKVERIYFPVKFHGQPAYDKRPPFLEFMSAEAEKDAVEPQEPGLNPATEELVKKFIALGGKEWVAGSRRHIYFNQDLLADLTSVRLSNYAKFYFDVSSMKFEGRDMNEGDKFEIARAIMEHLEEAPKLKRFILLDIETDTVMDDLDAPNPRAAIKTYRQNEQQREELYVQVTSTYGAPAGGYVVYEALENCADVEFTNSDHVREKCLQAGVFAVDTGHIDRVYIVGADDNDQGERVKVLMKSPYGDAFLVDDKICFQKKLPFDGNIDE